MITVAAMVRAPVTIAVVAALCAVVAAALAAPSSGAEAAAAVKICDHRYVTYGATRIRDNAWGGWTGRHPYCIETDGVRTMVLTNAVPDGSVVAYPSSETGPMFLWRDRRSGLPEPVTKLGRLTYNVGCGTAPGLWLCDVDAYLIPGQGWTGHASGELVIGNRWSTGTPSGQHVYIHGRWYEFRHWITTDGTYRWLIYVFRQVHQSAKASVTVGKFTWWLLRRGLLPRDARWYQDGAYGPEIWSGGRGLVFTKAISHAPAPLVPLSCLADPGTCTTVTQP
jgi:hypothetical protein